MCEEYKLCLGAIGIVAFVTVMAWADSVGEHRADALKACYEAAKVNPKISCEIAHD